MLKSWIQPEQYLRHVADTPVHIKAVPRTERKQAKDLVVKRLGDCGREGLLGMSLTLYSHGAPAAKNSTGFLFPLQETPLCFWQPQV